MYVGNTLTFYTFTAIYVPFRIFITFTFNYYVFHIFSGKSCELPAEWEGRWFEYGEREPISVSKRNVTHKGVCTYMDGDKYIFHEK